MFPLDQWPNRLLYTTTRISTDLQDHSRHSSGTGFFFSYRCPTGQSVRALITNRHVIYGRRDQETRGQFYTWQFYFRTDSEGVRNGQPGKECICVSGSDYDARWVITPERGEGSGYDLAALPLDGILEHLGSKEKQPFFLELNSEMIPKPEDLDAMSLVTDVLMPGYPSGFMDDEHMLPVIRKGTTASHPALQVGRDKDGAIDIGGHTGASGSPVVVPRQARNAPDLASDDLWLLGAFSNSLPAFERVAISGSSTRSPIGDIAAELQAPVQVPAHLGLYTRSEGLRALGELMCGHIAGWASGPDETDEDENDDML
jgi:hypothetical protein